MAKATRRARTCLLYTSRGADAQHPRHLALLRHGLARKFPVLRDIDVDYAWTGWVDVSHDMMPRITQPDPARQVYYAFGYGGNGVAFLSLIHI